MKNIVKLLLFAIPMLIPKEEVEIKLGDTSCKIIKTGNLNSKIKFLSIHENEKTAVEAYTSLAKETKSLLLLQVSQKNERNLQYKEDGKTYNFDPNRIFSDVGIDATLMKNNDGKTLPSTLKSNIKNVAEQILRQLKTDKKEDYIVAIHNNTNNNYSFRSYLKGGDEFGNAEKTSASKTDDVDDFIIVTSLKDFDYFKNLGRNVVLQSSNAKDDGSLSVYCQKNSISYINIESEQNHKTQQTKMILEAINYLKNK